MKLKFFLLIIILGIGGGIFVSFFVTHVKNVSGNVVVLKQAAQKQTVRITPTIVPGVPKTISIPKINVLANVESVGMDSKGRMDVPKNSVDTAWFSPGYRPGMNGSAVIDGHLDRVTGAPAVFWNLKELVPGDIIIITEDNGKKYRFAVDHTIKYPYNNFPIKEVFAASSTPMLNLITCNGVWDNDTKNYSDRLVVYSKLVSLN